ncbi:MAG: MarR family transcriptional regulator, temperature-dependent positive regulator of motility [Solirubrobacteraceae bacterium]|jgi:DNA-binding MarR family transcriptional regulator|nr:MarR family transcriptional regulator, temperature-dependent positive regulator of motility [Solirubrobacteraceae bacterium]
MSNEWPTGSIGLLMRLTRLIHRRETEDVIGMKLKHFIVLTQIRDFGGTVSQKALGESLNFDANNLVLLLNDIEIDDRIKRERDPSDRRRHVVVITKQGEKDLERAEELLETLEDDLLSGLDAEERVTLRRLLSRALEIRCANGDAQPLASAAATSS